MTLKPELFRGKATSVVSDAGQDERIKSQPRLCSCAHILNAVEFTSESTGMGSVSEKQCVSFSELLTGGHRVANSPVLNWNYLHT